MNIKPLFLSLFAVAVIAAGCGEPSRQDNINHIEKQVDGIVGNLDQVLKKMSKLDPSNASKYSDAASKLKDLTPVREQVRAAFKQFLQDCDESDLPIFRDAIDLVADVVKEVAKANGPADFMKLAGNFKSRNEALDKRFKSNPPKQKSAEAAAKMKFEILKLGLDSNMFVF